VTPSKLIAKREDLFCFALVFEPDQVTEQLINYFLEESAL